MLSFVREFGDDIVLCVNNLSRFAQPVELDLSQWQGVEPVELLGGTRFPAIGELQYLLTLAGHGFYWLRLPRPERQVSQIAPEADSHRTDRGQAAMNPHIADDGQLA